jgi:hypothetical protein
MQNGKKIKWKIDLVLWKMKILTKCLKNVQLLKLKIKKIKKLKKAAFLQVKRA